VNYEGGDTLLFQGGDNVVFKGVGYYSIRQKSGFVMFSNGENGIGIAKMLDSFTTAKNTIFNVDEQYPNTWYKILNVYNKQGYPAALNYFKTLAAKKDSSILLSDFKYWAGDGSYVDKEPEFAANIALEYESRYPSSEEAVALHGKAMMKMKKYDAAIADFKKAMQLNNGSQTEMERLITECSVKAKKGN
jgi:tetratricopeptide (TPR) repeat protein